MKKGKGKVMKKGKMLVSSLMVLVTACLCVSTSFAGMVEIKEMVFSYNAGLPYYSNETLGFSQSTSIVGDVAIPTGPGTVEWAYSIQNAVVTLSDMSLVSGFNTTTGTFDGSAAMVTVTGNLIKNSNSADLTGNVTLLEASMDSSTFEMSEIFSQFASGSTTFTTDGGALLAGVLDGDDTVVLEEFGMGLWGTGVNVLFGANSMSPYTAGVQITTDALVPEPATMGLLSLGMLILSRRRKNG